jgi:pimeloyl-ACP methyl ester carboxylesterase
VAEATNPDARKGVPVVLTGGPGEPGVPFLSEFAHRLAPVLADDRLVMLDQRGTGATALICPALQAQMGASDLRRPTAAAVRACAARIGPRRRFCTTLDTVADLELLRRALGVDRWVVDGTSRLVVVPHAGHSIQTNDAGGQGISALRQFLDG